MKITAFLLTLLFAGDIALSQPDDAKTSWRGPQTLEQLAAAPVALIPFAQQARWNNDRYLVQQNTVIVYAEKEAGTVANAVRSLNEFLTAHGIAVKQVKVNGNGRPPVNSIQFRIDVNLPVKEEGYTLQVTNKSVLITGKGPAGLYYGVQTLRQLLQKKNNSLRIPGCSITDWPAFGLRGFMHDNGRNFQSIDMLKKQLDRLAHYKYNTFHWHLTDNPAWRPQSNIYPQLNEAKNRKSGRDPDSSYSFDDIRELIRYARERSITIIPELDMPGHSKYFEPTFGFKMESEQGMQVLEKLVDEFCKEIPASDCPIIHIGSDEVHIPNPKEFISRMTARVKANGRQVMVWNPGLPPEPGTIEQVWMDDATKGERKSSNPYVDSYGGYLNYFDAFTLVQRYFFQQICNKPEGDSLAMGGIVCCWPDTRVDDKTKIPLHNAVWPGALTYSEAVWCGRPGYEAKYMSVLPEKGTTAADYFKEFETRLAKHRDQNFTDQSFPYVQFGNIEWQLTGPYYRSRTDSAYKAFAPEIEASDAIADTVKKIKATGGIIHPGEWIGAISKEANETVYLTGYIKSDKAKTIHAVLGFETAPRSNRRSAGIPDNGKWDTNGGAVFINGKELTGPQWKNPGGNRYLRATWETPANEIPFTDEEFYWSRPPAAVPLKKGWNKILVRVPRTFRDQNWQFAFVPVKRRNERWVEDVSVKLVANKNSK
ncbi:MAG TPA: beta-N-acetylhexosaminidase [Flavisolibacter sp.]|nr:beta-N-acetylhexosaminidase [Flavisolibacter sp.]